MASIFFSFDFGLLKDYLIQSPEIIYLLPRLLSIFLALVCLVFFNIYKENFL